MVKSAHESISQSIHSIVDTFVIWVVNQFQWRIQDYPDGCANPGRGALIYYYRPQRSFGQGYIFTGVCHSVNGGVYLVPGGGVAIWIKSDSIGKTELNPSFVLSSKNANSRNDIQLFLQLFDEHRVNGDYH